LGDENEMIDTLLIIIRYPHSKIDCVGEFI
jgi:hypothetical protein